MISYLNMCLKVSYFITRLLNIYMTRLVKLIVFGLVVEVCHLMVPWIHVGSGEGSLNFNKKGKLKFIGTKLYDKQL